MQPVVYNPNVLVATPNSIPAVVQMSQDYQEVQMEHKGKGIKPHAHGRKKRRSRR